MSKLHNKQCCAQVIQSEQPFLDNNNQALSKDTLRALNELGNILRKVQSRMTSEGYKIEKGCIQKM
jgi:hypothetical protein